MTMHGSIDAAMQPTDWNAVAADLHPVACDRSTGTLKRKSRDYYWFSPLLKEALADVRGDLVVMPADMAELERVVGYCSRHFLPLTIRGGGTGNYGQAMPLQGGVVLDMTRLNAVLSVDDESIRAQAGAKLVVMDKAAKAKDRELRFHPSTWKAATVGGFIAGGTTGCGAINFGTLHSAGNVRSLRVMTMEPVPRMIDLDGPAAQAVVHAYGTNGIIVEVELALAPARRWHDRIVAVRGLSDALAFADRLATDARIGMKQLALLDEAAARLMRPLAKRVEPGDVLVLTMVEEDSLPAFDAAVAEAAARIAFAAGPDTPVPGMPALYELCWNHTTLHAIGADPTISYLQVGLPDDYRAVVLGLAAEPGDETPMHLEFVRIDGALVVYALPLLRYSSAERLDAIHAIYRRHGCTIFNPHTHLLENGGLQVADPAQIGFRHTGDPAGLLNPGKMPGWDAPAIG